MHDAKVTLKDGTHLCGPLWEWAPKKGYFTLVDVDDKNRGSPIVVRLDDCTSAVHLRVRVHINEVKDVDLLERARNSGWVPSEPCR